MVGGTGMLNVTMMEDVIISGELVELEDVGRWPERREKKREEQD